jgi:hypothetical protein
MAKLTCQLFQDQDRPGGHIRGMSVGAAVNSRYSPSPAERRMRTGNRSSLSYACEEPTIKAAISLNAGALALLASSILSIRDAWAMESIPARLERAMLFEMHWVMKKGPLRALPWVPKSSRMNWRRRSQANKSLARSNNMNRSGSRSAEAVARATCNHRIRCRGRISGRGSEAKPAEPAVRAANHAVLSRLPFANQDDYQDAARLHRNNSDALVTGLGGNIVWSQRLASSTTSGWIPSIRPVAAGAAKPSARVVQGVDSLYRSRIRHFQHDVIEGISGLIVIDPLLGRNRQAALDLYQHRPRRPVVAVIYTHSHADHWGGVKGVTNEADVASGKVAVIAPEGFLKHAVSENVIAGNAMRRRALYQFGPLLPKGERGQVDTGLGKTITLGTTSLIAPTDLVHRSGETRTIDGVEIVFRDGARRAKRRPNSTCTIPSSRF